MYTNWKIGEFFLLLSQFLERVAHYSITANIVLMLINEPFNWHNYNALSTPFLLNGFCFISSIAGGILSDTYLRKTTTVIIGYVFYATYIGFPYLFWDNILPELCNHNEKDNKQISLSMENCSDILLPSIILSGIGSGLVRSVSASIGSDMAIQKWENASTFFNLYYWCLNCGSLIAFMLMSYIQHSLSRRWGYMTPTILLALSFISFLSGGPYYIHIKKPSTSTIKMVFKIYSQAFQKKIALMRCNPPPLEDLSESTENIISKKHSVSLFGEESDVEHDYPDMFNSLTKDCSISQNNTSIINFPEGPMTSSSNIIETQSIIRTENISFFDRCQVRFGGTFKESEVQDVRRFSYILMILLFMIPYYMMYFQMESTFMYQGIQMKIYVGSNTDFSIPASWLIVLDIILLMVLLPILVKFIYPWLKKKKMYIRHTTKIALGFIFICLSMVIAGCIETRRIYVHWELNETKKQTIDNITNFATDMSIFYQVPQYVMMGLSEALAVVAGLELACTQVSSSMQGLANGLFWFASGIGSFIGSGGLFIFQNIYFHDYTRCPGNNLSCHLNFYFFSLAGFILIIFILFVLFLSKYRKLERMEQTQLLMRRISI